MAEVEESHSADKLRFLRRRTVMLAMDGSKHSQYAFQWYIENLHKKTDDVIMVYCTENFHLPSSALVGAGDNSIHDLYHAHAEHVKEVFKDIDDLAKKHKITHKLEHITGYPGASIVKAAEEQRAGMIICGSRGMGLIRRTILGSVSDYVLHHAHIPVIVVKHEDEQKKLKRERTTSTSSARERTISASSTGGHGTQRQISTQSTPW